MLSALILASLIQALLALQCAPGSYITVEDKCEPCIAGSFQPLADQTSCIPCQDGLVSREESSIQCVACRDGEVASRFRNKCVCRPGWFRSQNNSECMPCPPGTSSRQEESSECFACAPSHFNANFGQTRCSKCAEGTFALQGSRAENCTPCSEGGALQSTFSCGPCPEFHEPNLNVFDTQLDCVRSMFGRSLPTPRPGADGLLQQALCPGGLLSQFDGRAFDISTCTFVGCADGTGVLQDGSCAVCSAGTFYNRATNECELCAPRSFTAEPNVYSACFRCSGNSFSMRGATECIECPINQALMADGRCSGCAAGTFYMEEELRCAPCPINTYSNGEIRERNVCSECAPGTFSFVGSSSCDEDACGRDSAPMRDTNECGTCAPGSSYARTGVCEMCQSDLLSGVPRAKVHFGLFGCEFCRSGAEGTPSADRSTCR